jgi:hypothetical protein
MKFLKRNQLNFRNVKDNRVAVENTDEVLLDTLNAVLIPNGPTVNRPGESGTITNPKVGHMRYNTDDQEFEVRQGGGLDPATGVPVAEAWRRIRYKEPALITQQNLGNGDAAEIYFGPLDSGHLEYPYPDLTNPQNLMVFIENVFQISTTNYTLADNPVSTISVAKTNGNPTLITSEATDSMIGATVTGSGISGTVTGVIQGTSLTLDTPVSGAGTVTATVTRDGRFIEFTSEVPYGKPVTVIHGFDR